MAKFIIGGVTIIVDLPNFVVLERAWRYVEEAQKAPGAMEKVVAALCLVSVGRVDMPMPLATDEGDLEVSARVAALKEKLTPAEMLRLKNSVEDLLVEVGLAVRVQVGERAPSGEGTTGSPSTATSAA